VKLLLDAGAQKDQQNSLGWTPLHEASFFNQVNGCRALRRKDVAGSPTAVVQIDIVKMLLVYGADATIRNHQGALPYHLASLPELRTIIKVRRLCTITIIITSSSLSRSDHWHLLASHHRPALHST
jgi:ankyrin repeat protein